MAKSKMRIERYTHLDESLDESLRTFLHENEEYSFPYHFLEFCQVIEEVFGYQNLSLVALDALGKVAGYLPQWKRGTVIESVPWRDRGGPVCRDEDVVKAFIDATKSMVRERRVKGFIWKGFETPLLDNYRYFVNVEIDLSKYTAESYWKSLSCKERNTIRSAQKNGLTFRVENNELLKTIESFYALFVNNRKRLGVPVYPMKLFHSYMRNFPGEKIKIFSVSTGGEGSVISSLILLHNKVRGVEAYFASNERALTLKGNDLMMFGVITYCMNNGLRYYDFGADSPIQKSLIDYKLKWLGEKTELSTSFYGDVREGDHNKPQYLFFRRILRGMPMPLYRALSHIVMKWS